MTTIADSSPTATPEWQQAIVAAAEHLHRTQPMLDKARLQKAMDLALTPGAVRLDTNDDHGALVTTEGGSRFVNGVCPCEDFQYHGPDCKHRLAIALTRDAQQRLALPTPQATPPAPVTLPEAPASVNVRLTLHGHEVQFTLRDHDEHRLLARLEVLLAGIPAPEASLKAKAPTSNPIPVCAYHGVMKPSTKVPGTFYCTAKMGDGSYCKSRSPEQGV